MPGSQQVWIDNPAYFDHRLPRTALQLIAVDIASLRTGPPPSAQPDAGGLAREFFAHADWQGIARDVLKGGTPPARSRTSSNTPASSAHPMRARTASRSPRHRWPT